MSTASWKDLAAAYVLDALDAEERREFEARLRSDPDLRAEVDAQREVLGILADAVPARPAPAGLRDRILSEARAARPIASAPSADASTSADGPSAGASTPPPASAPSSPGAAADPR